MKDALRVIDCGLQNYIEVWDLQHRLAKARAEGRVPDTLLLVEHPPVITLGRKGSYESIRVSQELLHELGVRVIAVERGGDATFHGPGQLIGYPIIVIQGRGRKVRAFVQSLEEVMIRVLGDFTIIANRNPGNPGVWVDGAKIGAIGITVQHQVSFHGFALNVNNDLSGFDLIHPCGMRGVAVTSMANCLGNSVSMDLVKGSLVWQCAVVLDRAITQIEQSGSSLNELRPLTVEDI